MRILVNGVEVRCQGADVRVVATAAEWRAVTFAALQASPIGSGVVGLPGGQLVTVELVGVVPVEPLPYKGPII